MILYSNKIPKFWKLPISCFEILNSYRYSFTVINCFQRSVQKFSCILWRTFAGIYSEKTSPYSSMGQKKTFHPVHFLSYILATYQLCNISARSNKLYLSASRLKFSCYGECYRIALRSSEVWFLVKYSADTIHRLIYRNQGVPIVNFFFWRRTFLYTNVIKKPREIFENIWWNPTWISVVVIKTL